MPPSKAVKVTIGGTEQELRYEKKTIYRLERRVGKTIFQLFNDMGAGSFSAMVDLVWAGLQHANPNQTPEDVAELVDFDELKDVMMGAADGLGFIMGARKEAGPLAAAPEEEKTATQA